MGKERSLSAREHVEEVLDELEQEISQQDYSSIEIQQEFASQYIQRINQQPLDDFSGLSPDQMHRLLYNPFSSPKLSQFPDVLDSTPEAPVLTLFDLLVTAIGSDGLKTTARGFLPRKTCQEIAQQYRSDERYKTEITFNAPVYNEEDFFELHTVRLLAGMSGLIRKYKGRFILSRQCREVLSESGMAGIYPILFKSYAQEFNWSYNDLYAELPFIQHSFPFSLYLLNRFGSDWQPAAFYEDRYLQAFPFILDDIPPSSYQSPEWRFRRCYFYQTMERFAEFFGLVEIDNRSKDILKPDYYVKSKPLLAQVVQFHI